jgi:lipopolysaccharide transport system ATP-binding protein
VASLLEVGTGFHPELTGRENIFLNGAILGMMKSEIEKKFDEIVDFAEVERFLDTPVKRYSSGMYVRLAFAVAAHLEPEILLVDEVLAVGDAQFQKKCLGKMGQAGKEGRTIFFVSHNMHAIERLCTTGLFLEKGTIVQYDRNIKLVIKNYLSLLENQVKETEWVNSGNDYENSWFKPLRLRVMGDSGTKPQSFVSNDSDLYVYIEGIIIKSDPSLQIGYAIYTEEGNLLYWSFHTDRERDQWPDLKEGRNVLRTRIPKRFLNEGTYRIELIAALYYKQWICEPGNNTPSVYVTLQGGLSNSPYWIGKRPGILAPTLEWEIP